MYVFIFQILTTAGEKTVALPDSISLALIRRDICDNPDSEIIIYYRIFPHGLSQNWNLIWLPQSMRGICNISNSAKEIIESNRVNVKSK